MGRVLGIDYGRERVGLAVSDGAGLLAQPLEVLHRAKRKGLVDAVIETARRLDVSEIVVGLPLRMDGTPGSAAEAVEQFAQTLRERGDWPVALFDERLSTSEATRRMRAAGVTDRDARGQVDKVAAAVILRAFLDSRRPATDTADDAVLPEVAPRPETDGPHTHTEGGKATSKRRAASKQARRRTGRRGWKRDLDDD